MATGLDNQDREEAAEFKNTKSGSEEHFENEEDEENIGDSEEAKDEDKDEDEEDDSDEDEDDDDDGDEEDDSDKDEDDDDDGDEDEDEDEEDEVYIEELLQRPPDTPDHRGRLPLHMAAAQEEDSDDGLTVLDAVEALLELFPAGAATQDKAGKLPLHHAVAASSTLGVGVVQALLRKYPGGAAVPDRSGYLPLNYAFKECADDDAVCALLEVYPAAAAAPAFPGHDLLPLHLCLEDLSSPEVVGALVAAHPDGALTRPFGGATVLELCRGNLDFVNAVLEHCPAAAQVKDEEGKVALHLAAEINELEVLEALLYAFPEGATQQDHDGNTPLHAACTAGCLGTVERILQLKPEAARICNKLDEMPLHVAAGYSGAAELVELVSKAFPEALRSPAANGWLPLHFSVAADADQPCSIDIVRLLLDRNPEGAQTSDRQKRLPLHWAVANPEAGPDITLALLGSHPAAVFHKDKWHSSPLHLAAQGQCDQEVVVALLEAFPEAASSRNDISGLPIHCYLTRQDLPLDVLRALVHAYPEGLYVPGKDHGQLPLEMAIDGSAARDVLEFLVESCAARATGHAGQDGRLPLHLALIRKSLAPVLVLPLLRNFPSAASAKDKYGRLPLHYAAQLKDSDCSLQLVMAVLDCYPDGAQVADDEQKLPLHHASVSGAAAVVESLVSRWPPGARRRDAEGCLPLHYAAARDRTEGAAQMVECLVGCHPDAVQVESSGGYLPDSDDDEVKRLLDYKAAHKTCSNHLLGCRNAPEFSLHKHGRYGNTLARFAAAHPSCLDTRCKDGETLFDGAEPSVRRALREATCFLGRYQLQRREPAHRSRTCVVFLALDTAPAPGSPEQVALKIMRRQASFLAEMTTRYDNGDGVLDDTHVVGILGAYAEMSTREAVVDSGGLPARGSVEWVERVGGALSSGDYSGGLEEHRFCIVMEAADCNLHDAIENEDFAGQRWHVVRQIAVDVAEALDHLHSRGIAHMDVKPRNVVRVSGRWRLIDMDLARALGEPCSDKPPSTGFCSPEIARLMVGGDAAKIETHHAGLADDLWSYGALLYSLATGRTMWHVDHSTDNIGGYSLEALAGWSEGHLSDRLKEAKQLREGSPVLDLLTRLLEADRDERARRFQGGFKDLLRHPFFEDMARPLSLFINEQLGPEERTRRRVAEAQNLVRSPTDGFLVFRLRNLGKGGLVSSLPDNEWLKDFKQKVQDQLKAELGSSIPPHRHLRDLHEHAEELHRQLENPSWGKAPEAKREQLQAQLQQRLSVAEAHLAVLEGSEPLRNLMYLLHLANVLHTIRNFTSHFNSSEGSSVEMPLHRRHGRFLLDTCARFFMCLLHLAVGYPSIAGYDPTEAGAQERTVGQLQAWAQRCSQLLADQYEDDCSHPMVMDEPLAYSVPDAEELWELCTCYLLTLIKIAMPLKNLQGGKRQQAPPQWRLPEFDNVAPFQWLEELHRYLDLVSEASSSHIFTDPAWGCALAQELLDHKHERLPRWAAAASAASARRTEISARFAMFLGGTRHHTTAHIKQMLSRVARESQEMSSVLSM